MSAPAERGRLLGTEATPRIDLGVKNERISAALEAHGPTIEQIVGGVTRMFPEEVRIDDATFDPRLITSKKPADQYPASGYVRTITFGGHPHPSGKDSRNDLIPHLSPPDDRAIIPQVKIGLTPDREAEEGSAEAYSATGKSLVLEVSARVLAPVTDEERGRAAESGLFFKEKESVREPVEVGFQAHEGSDTAAQVEAFLDIVRPRYGDPFTHVFLNRLPQEEVIIDGHPR